MAYRAFPCSVAEERSYWFVQIFKDQTETLRRSILRGMWEHSQLLT